MKEVKKNDKMKFYSLKKIKGYKALYNVIFGERSNGKTFACLEEIVRNYFEKGEQGAYIRRWQDDIVKKRAEQVFEGIVKENLISKYSKGEYNTVVYASGKWYPAKQEIDVDNKRKIQTASTPLCFAFSLSAQEHDKSTAYPHITTIVFDEFITRTYYLPDEFILFTNVLSTIIRSRDNVTVYMLANTVNKYTPYFAEMGLTHAKSMEQGTIDLYEYGDSGLTVAVEYINPLNQSKPSDKYFAFNNPKLKMITKGSWEIDVYPHAPIKIRPCDIVFSYFIKFGDDILQCDIIVLDNGSFTYIHRKTTPIQDEDNDLIFSYEYDRRFNWRRNILKPIDELGQKIAYYYKAEKIFYQSNDIGEIIRNYLMNCKNQSV